jgi:hypothetical protein
MQTIKINIEQTANGYEFTTGSKAVATIRKDVNGTFWAMFQAYATANNLRTLPDAVEFISDAISHHLTA